MFQVKSDLESPLQTQESVKEEEEEEEEEEETEAAPNPELAAEARVLTAHIASIHRERCSELSSLLATGLG